MRLGPHGFRDYEISVLAFVWIAPLIARSVAGTIGLPLGLMAMLALYALTLRRAVLGMAPGATSPRPRSLAPRLTPVRDRSVSIATDPALAIRRRDSSLRTISRHFPRIATMAH